MIWISGHIHITMWIQLFMHALISKVVISHVWLNFKSFFIKQDLQLEHEWMIISCIEQWMQLIYHAIMFNHVSKTGPHATVPFSKHDFSDVLALISNHISFLCNDYLSLMTYSIMMLVRFGDLSQSDCSKWVMWQVKDPQPRPGWDGCLTWEKVAFIKCVKKIK